MIIVFYAGETEVVPVECEVPGWPNKDVTGKTMYENTHFLTEAEAWNRVLTEADAHVKFEARNVQQFRDRLREAKKDLTEAAQRQQQAMKNRRAAQK